ncbi:restriction endonuclease subunit S [Candidatus Thiodictyon syntrophicum]|jgi:type I restriction enzyme S subunit|uniref:Type I restriction modification DNA specificity domain-containing protein n=1 Tax=Candidatus Thiodictyon syntrophicum TaxID=1166950 RepID=A0A2K8U823_9GAMM|nr:restriction endonuclease subunit S [Candidatus Thiodictyon syntrophicum]AUB81201.1 hypothetical protein THSYN_09720 [Candidatus Thiodictyon syntrophicum]
MKWKETVFDDLARLNRGFDLPSHQIEDGPYPVVASTSIAAFHKAFKVEGPGVVTGRSGSLGKVQYLPGRFWPLNTSLYVKDFKGNNEKFVAYFLETMRLENFNSGAGVPTLNQNHLHKLSVSIPPLFFQRKIAGILTVYDDLIDTNKRRIVLLEKMGDEIYHEWFVRMRFPDHQNGRIIRGMPEGWERKRFGDFCMLKRGYDLPNDLVEEGPYPVVASTSVKTFHKHYKVEPPVITTGRSGSLGDVLMTHTRAWPLNTVLYVRKFFGNSPFLVYYTLKNMGLEKFNSGAGIPTLNRNHVNGIPMVVPDKNLQQQFDRIVDPIHKQAENFRQENINLTKTRDLLLPRLISGKLSVADLDIQFPPSMCEGAKGQDRGDASG